MKFWDEANGLIEGEIIIYLLHVINRITFKQYTIFQ